MKEEKVTILYYVYILLCQDGSLYTGHSRDVHERFRLHATGKGARYTRIHKPKKIVYVEPATSRGQAMKRERAIKKMSRQQKIHLFSLPKDLEAKQE
jgi:putative endonuclease